MQTTRDAVAAAEIRREQTATPASRTAASTDCSRPHELEQFRDETDHRRNTLLEQTRAAAALANEIAAAGIAIGRNSRSRATNALPSKRSSKRSGLACASRRCRIDRSSRADGRSAFRRGRHPHGCTEPIGRSSPPARVASGRAGPLEGSAHRGRRTPPHSRRTGKPAGRNWRRREADAGELAKADSGRPTSRGARHARRFVASRCADGRAGGNGAGRKSPISGHRIRVGRPVRILGLERGSRGRAGFLPLTPCAAAPRIRRVAPLGCRKSSTDERASSAGPIDSSALIPNTPRWCTHLLSRTWIVETFAVASRTGPFARRPRNSMDYDRWAGSRSRRQPSIGAAAIRGRADFTPQRTACVAIANRRIPTKHRTTGIAFRDAGTASRAGTSLN